MFTQKRIYDIRLTPEAVKQPLRFELQRITAHDDTLSEQDLLDALPHLGMVIKQLYSKQCKYPLKAELCDLLQHLAARLLDRTAERRFRLSERQKEQVRQKLTTDRHASYTALHICLHEVVFSIEKPVFNFVELLQLTREHMVATFAAQLTPFKDEVETIIYTANLLGYGVRARKAQLYDHNVYDDRFDDDLMSMFSSRYTPYAIPGWVCAFLKSKLSYVYTGPKGQGSQASDNASSDDAYTKSQFEDMVFTLRKFLFPTVMQFSVDKYFIVDDENVCVIDINWLAIQKEIFHEIATKYCYCEVLKPKTMQELVLAFELGADVDNDDVRRVLDDENKLQDNIHYLSNHYTEHPLGFKVIINHRSFRMLLPHLDIENLPDLMIEAFSLNQLMDNCLQLCKYLANFYMDSTDCHTIIEFCLVQILVRKLKNRDDLHMFVVRLSDLLDSNPSSDGKNGFYALIDKLALVLEWREYDMRARIMSILHALLVKAIQFSVLDEFVKGFVRPVRYCCEGGLNLNCLHRLSTAIVSRVYRGFATEAYDVLLFLHNTLDAVNNTDLLNRVMFAFLQVDERSSFTNCGLNLLIASFNQVINFRAYDDIASLITGILLKISHASVDAVADHLLTHFIHTQQSSFTNFYTNISELALCLRSLAVQCNHSQTTHAISEIILLLLSQAEGDDLEKFITGLGESRRLIFSYRVHGSGLAPFGPLRKIDISEHLDGIGTLVDALFLTIANNDRASATLIFRILEALQKKASGHLSRQLITHFTHQYSRHDYFTALCHISHALPHAVENNNDGMVRAMLRLQLSFFNETDVVCIKRLFYGFVNDKTYWMISKHENALYGVLQALALAAKYQNEKVIISITCFLAMLLTKSEMVSNSLITAFAQATTVDDVNLNGLYWLMDALDRAISHRMRVASKAIAHVLSLVLRKANQPDTFRQLTTCFTDLATKNPQRFVKDCETTLMLFKTSADIIDVTKQQALAVLIFTLLKELSKHRSLQLSQSSLVLLLDQQSALCKPLKQWVDAQTVPPDTIDSQTALGKLMSTCGLFVRPQEFPQRVDDAPVMQLMKNP